MRQKKTQVKQPSKTSPSKNVKPKNTNPLKLEATPARMIEAYRKDGDKYNTYMISRDGVFYVDARVTTVSGSFSVRGIDRFVIFSSDNTPLFVFDAIPAENENEGALLEWKPNEANGKIIIKGHVRGFLQLINSVNVEIEIERVRKNSSPRLEKFRVADASIQNLNKDNFEETLRNGFREFSAFGDFSYGSKFEREINLKSCSGAAACSRNLKISFKKLKETFYAFQFEVSFNNFRSTDVETVKAFGDENPLSIEVKTAPLSWKLVQYPSNELEANPKKIIKGFNKPVSKWIVRVDGFPATDVVNLWNEYATQYYEALQTVQGGLPVSFLPLLNALPQQELKKWSLSYLLLDASHDRDEGDFVYGASNEKEILQPTMNKISVFALTLQPTEIQTLATQLVQLKKHNEKALTGGTVEVQISGRENFEPSEETDKGIRVSFKKPLLSANDGKTTSVRMGALDLEFATQAAEIKAPETPFFFKLRPYRNLLEQNLLEAGVDAMFAVHQVGAGGQDSIPGDEFVPEGSSASSVERCVINFNDQDLLKGIEEKLKSTPAADIEELKDEGKDSITENNFEAHFRRKRPLVIDPEAKISPDVKPTEYLLIVNEAAQKGSSQTLRLTLQILPKKPENVSNAPAKPKTANAVKEIIPLKKAIVLDSDPFLVARVEFLPFARQTAEGTEIGNWTNAGTEGVNWQLKSLAKPFHLILPPQGIGEEMEKGKNIDAKKSIDFRLSPPADITLKGSDNPQNFTEPPWNLRRLLGYHGQRNQGAGIDQLQFELLYGLSCDSKHPFLRLAEIASLIGAIQGRLPREAKSATVWKDAQLRAYYKLARLEWAMLYRRYLSRVAVLEPWDAHQPEKLLINENTVCQIRNVGTPIPGTTKLLPRAELFNPVGEEKESQEDLKGGVTWGFESKNVYCAVMKCDENKNPQSDPAEVSDLYFSSFGGWGHVKAPFDDKKSTIYGDVSMGRTYSYKLERIGRIGVWWNLARHVIVYERTVAPSRQMNGLQNPLFGRPIIRKVQEYVEILEETRHYPDGQNAQSESLKQQRGFVSACSFPKGARYNVLSSWGSEVEDIGWKVPLWNPTATPADVYPKPQVHLELFSDVAGESVPVPCVIKSPENLYFYTETRAGSSGNPHEWDPVKNIDFVDLPKPQPLPDFEGGKNMQTTPDDPAVPVGFSPCTFSLEPSPTPTNIVAERVGKPLSAVLETVTMMRARVKDAVQTGNEGHEKLLSLRNETAKVYQDIVKEIPSSEIAASERLTEIKRNIEAKINGVLGGKIEAIKNDLQLIETKLNNQKNGLQEKIKNYETGIFERLKAGLQEIDKGVVSHVLKDYDELLREAAIDFDAKKKQYLNRALQNLRKLQEGLLLLNASSGILQKAVQKYLDAYLHWVNESERVARQIRLPNVDLQGEELRQFQNQLRSLVNLIESLEEQVKNGIYRPVETWLPDPYAKLAVEYFNSIKTKYNDKKNEIDLALQEREKILRDKAKEIVDLFIKLKFKAPSQLDDDFKKLNDFRNTLPNIEEKFKQLADSRLIITGQTRKWEGWIGEQIDKIEKLGDSPSFSDFRTAVNELKDKVNLTNQVAGNLFDELEKIKKEVLFETSQPTLQNLLTLVSRSAKQLIDELNALLDKERLKREINSISQDIRQKVEAIGKEFVNKAEDFIEKNVRELLPPDKLVYATADSVARLVRAFGRPPEVPNLSFQRPQVAYFYKELDQAVGLTPVISKVAQASAIAEELQALGVALPTERILERLVPPNLRNFNFSEIIPKIAGLDLSNLFAGLKMPEMGTENVKISHGVDVQSRRAWVQSDVKVEITEPATIFSIGPVILRLTSALFVANMRFEAGLNEPPKRVVFGSIKGTWELIISDIPLVRFKNTELKFDDSGNFRFNLSPKNVELPGVMAFVSDFLKKFSNPDSGFSIGLLPNGIQALLNLPIPDIQSGTSGISNLVLGMAFGLDFSEDFKITLSFMLARKEAPFALTVFILGGGGYIEVVTAYTPSKQLITCNVEVGITASASLAISLGPIKGGVYVYLGIFANLGLSNQGGTGLTIGVMLLIRGVVDVLGIASASISLLLEVSYRGGQLTGRGKLSIRIKICWCFTLKVDKEVTYTLGSGGGSARNDQLPSFEETTAVRYEKAVYRPNQRNLQTTSSTRERGGPAEYVAISESFPLVVGVIDELAEAYIEMLS